MFADEDSNAARSEMLGFFLSFFDEAEKKFGMDFVSLVEVSSTSSEIVMAAVEKVMRDKNTDLTKIRFSSLDGTNSMSDEHNGLQRRIRNHAPHAIYINCRCHRLAFCFKHLMNDFPRLVTTDSLLLGLWKTFYYSSRNRFILKELQEAYGIKALTVVKAAVTRWLSNGVACKRCRERYSVIVEALNNIIVKNPKPELMGYRSQLLDSTTILKISFLEDVISITNTLSLVLQADRKDFCAVQRALNTTLEMLQDISENPESKHLKSSQISAEIINQLNDFEEQNVISRGKRKRRRVENSTTAAEIHTHQTISLALIDEIKGAFDMSSIAPVEALLSIDPESILDVNHRDFSMYGTDAIKTIFQFYGTSKEDTYLGHKVFATGLFIGATKESLELEYGGYKNYVSNRKNVLREKFNSKKKALTTHFNNIKADKNKSNSILKSLEIELKDIEAKCKSPLNALDLLNDGVIESAFPNVKILLRLLVLITQSEAVVERGFSKMKLIMTNERTNLDPRNLESLMRISFKSNALCSEEINEIIRIWSSQRNRRIFSKEI